MKETLESILHYFQSLETEVPPREELDALLADLPRDYTEIHQLARSLDPEEIHRALNNKSQMGEEAPTHGTMAYKKPDTPRHAKPSTKTIDPTLGEYEELLKALRDAISSI